MTGCAMTFVGYTCYVEQTMYLTVLYAVSIIYQVLVQSVRVL